ncbi:hypothetical protein B0H17DRAFT_1148747 [Mycena rosella]|uniref:BRCT domain-containing protein n=1 Tax=Mycena rosella TaxID=1033263 RepID=A0AAD7C9C7_MYCRO|nr:hypothetical protein B0H17DRAFT_1148747 [Mycena rosella]
MAVDGQLFRGVKYWICSSLPGTEQARLRHDLDGNGAQHASELKLATRVLTNRVHFSEFQGPECKAALVTPQWVYDSVNAGMKQLSKYYSADPAMLFSSLVISAVGVSATHANLIRTIVTKFGGQWTATLTKQITHLIVDTLLDSSLPINSHIIVVSHAWFSDSLELESLQDTAQYELLRRKGTSSSASAAHQLTTPSKAQIRTPTIPRESLPFLPFEILCKIHLICRDLAFDEATRYISTLLGLSQVCQRWRGITHCNSPLWTHISLDFHTKKSYNRLVKLVESRWIARSGSHPLTVNIRSYYPRSPNPAMDFLVAHAPRIRDLSLRLAAEQFHSFFRIAPKSFPTLETVTLSVIPTSDLVFDPNLGMTRSEYFAVDMAYGDVDPGMLWGNMNFPISVFKNAPKLRGITINTGGDMDPHILRLPWTSLTHVDLRYVAMGVHDTRRLLPLLVNVVEFNSSTGPLQGRIMPPVSAFKLPIQKLTWTGLRVCDISIFIPLILPNLKSLDMREGSGRSLLVLQEHSSFALQELTLTFFELSFPVLSKVARATPSITTLELRLSTALTEQLMEFLTFDDRKPILPHLKNLTLFDRCPHPYFSERTMMRMVESRWSPGTVPPCYALHHVDIWLQTSQGHPAWFASKAIVPGGISIIPPLAPAVRNLILDRIAEMNEEGLSFSYRAMV